MASKVAKRHTKTEIAKMRVAVAKDVIKRLKAKRYIARRGLYVKGLKELLPKDFEGVLDTMKDILARGDDSAYNVRNLMKASGDLVGTNQSFASVIRKSKKCDVCAKGALFLSTVDKYNRCDLLDAGEIGFGSRDPSDLIDWLFDSNQLDDIEAAFEDGHPGFTAEEILIKIMQNIVVNKGTFKQGEFYNTVDSHVPD